MCGRYTLRRVDLAHYGVRHPGDLAGFEEFTERPRFNIAPSQHVPIVRLNREGVRVLSAVRWGLIPHWTKGKPKAQPINARAETVRTSGMFRQAFARRRCLVPADGFYEWQKLGGKAKQPMFVRRPGDRPFAFAGVWERWQPEEGVEPVDTFAIITTRPNALMGPIHDRMPVILPEEGYASWLDREAEREQAEELLEPYPDGELEAVAVGRAVNSPGNDTCECVAPLA